MVASILAFPGAALAQANIVAPGESYLPDAPKADDKKLDNPAPEQNKPEPPTRPLEPIAPAVEPLPPPPSSALPLSNGPQTAAPRYSSLVHGHKPSPSWTQDRNFSTTRFWLLDPGQFAIETWADLRFNHDFGGTVGRPNGDWLFQNEIEIGVFPHVQIDIYENLLYNDDGSGTGNRSLQQEGVQLEARIAIPSYYGQIFGNPVVYVEFHPRHNQPDRGEIKLLLGGALSDRVFVAVNPYLESNLETTPGGGGMDAKGNPVDKMIYDAEAGLAGAIGVKVTDWLRLSLQFKSGVDMLGTSTNDWHFVAWAGPGFILRPLPGKLAQYLKIVGTFLVDVTGKTWSPDAAPQQFEPVVIVGTQF